MMTPAGHIEVSVHLNHVSVKTIAAAKFKANCLTLVDDVHQNREPIVITKRGSRLLSSYQLETRIGNSGADRRALFAS